MSGAAKWGVVYSHASEDTIPGLVDEARTYLEASAKLASVKDAQPGVKGTIAHRAEGADWKVIGTRQTPIQWIRATREED